MVMATNRRTAQRLSGLGGKRGPKLQRRRWCHTGLSSPPSSPQADWVNTQGFSEGGEQQPARGDAGRKYHLPLKAGGFL